MAPKYHDRRDAGRQLAGLLSSYTGIDNVLVLALPRGGVPVALEVANALQARLDLLLVRKLGVPGNPELAMGAIASGGVQVLNEDVVAYHGISEQEIQRVVVSEQRELDRRSRLYRGDRSAPVIEGRTVIVIDDGVATGATLRAGLQALREANPEKVIVAVPVGPASTIEALGRSADEVICPMIPIEFRAIGQFYTDFSQVTDDEVINALKQSWGLVA